MGNRDDRIAAVLGRGAGARSFLVRLLRDTRANTIAIMAAALIPLAGLVGGGVDISRMYITKTRLQHACDAGALAGRKQMGAGTWAYNDYAARTAAEKFFDANIKADPYGASALTRTFTESGGKVSGTASATLPMTLMRVFGRTTETLTVTCDAEMRLPNTDVMFVLDVTGSMDDKAVSTDVDDKITSLKKSVKCFYEVVANRDTTATCTSTGTGTGIPSSVQIRFGFVPYATNVNVGKLLPTRFFADSWSYQTRRANWNTSTSSSYGPVVDSVGSPGGGDSDWSDFEVVDTRFIWCPTNPGDQNNVNGTYTMDTDVQTAPNGTRTWTTRTYSKYNADYETGYSGWNCNLYLRKKGTGNYTVVVHTQAMTTTTTQTFRDYTYDRLTLDVSGLKNGTAWNNSFQLPIGTNGAMKTLTWGGCIEERATVRTTNFAPIPSGAHDLDIDEVPDPNDPDTLWGPVLPGAIYTRQLTSDGGGSRNTAAVTTTAEYTNSSNYYCPQEGRKLQAWNDATTFETYVDSLSPSGNTYHDIGLLWGARLMSPTGIFASENAQTPTGGDINRHLIFMTDGEACTGVMNYTAYGVAWYDRRQTSASSAPTDGCLTTGTLTEQVNLRTAALCTAVKNKNITLWVIWFGVSNTTIEDMLRNCATSGRFYTARNSADLQQTFSSIASQISQLRLTR